MTLLVVGPELKEFARTEAKTPEEAADFLYEHFGIDDHAALEAFCAPINRCDRQGRVEQSTRAMPQARSAAVAPVADAALRGEFARNGLDPDAGVAAAYAARQAAATRRALDTVPDAELANLARAFGMTPAAYLAAYHSGSRAAFDASILATRRK